MPVHLGIGRRCVEGTLEIDLPRRREGKLIASLRHRQPGAGVVGIGHEDVDPLLDGVPLLAGIHLLPQPAPLRSAEQRRQTAGLLGGMLLSENAEERLEVDGVARIADDARGVHLDRVIGIGREILGTGLEGLGEPRSLRRRQQRRGGRGCRVAGQPGRRVIRHSGSRRTVEGWKGRI